MALRHGVRSPSFDGLGNFSCPDLGTESDDMFSSEYSGSSVAQSRYDRYGVLPGIGRQLRIGIVTLWQILDSKDRRKTINIASCPFGAISSTWRYPDTDFKVIQKEVSPILLDRFLSPTLYDGKDRGRCFATGAAEKRIVASKHDSTFAKRQDAK